MGGKCAIHNTQYTPHDLRIAGEQKSKLKGKAQYPLLNLLMGHTSSTNKAALSAIRRVFVIRRVLAVRRALPLGQKPLRLQLNATSLTVLICQRRGLLDDENYCICQPWLPLDSTH